MYDEIIKAQKDNSLTINYNKWISDIISPYLGSRIMDVGGGMGNFLQYILDKESVVVVDVLDVFIENLHKLSCLHKNVHVFGCDIQDPSIVKIGNRYSIDSVICNNVLEHVQDD